MSRAGDGRPEFNVSIPARPAIGANRVRSGDVIGAGTDLTRFKPLAPPGDGLGQTLLQGGPGSPAGGVGKATRVGQQSAHLGVGRTQPGVLLLGSVFLVAPGDVRGLAAAIGWALDMPSAERTRRVEAAQQAVAARLSLDAFAERTLAVYAQAAVV